MMFKVGQKVVCIRADCDAGKYWGLQDAPVLGRIYTVSAAEFTSSITGRQCIGIAELTPPPSGGYRTSRFRPLVERKTDIGFAHEILRKASKKAPALADSPALRESNND
jgi:hypothetical protein